jgi:hypothetical protein
MSSGTVRVKGSRSYEPFAILKNPDSDGGLGMVVPAWRPRITKDWARNVPIT